MQIKAIVFDVNETLLDLQKLKDSVDQVLEKKGAAEVWFTSLLHYSLVESIRDEYHDFSEIAAAVLKMQAEKDSKKLSEDHIKDTLAVVKDLDPYPDVLPGLQKLKEYGVKLIAFSNGKPDVLNAQLKNAGIATLFDEIHSVDACKKYKPHPHSYKYILEKVDLPANKVLMVAAHGWDIAGAKSAGLNTCFVNRPGKVNYPLAPEPDHQVKGIDELVPVIKRDS
ncbi:haloacid dehalogenase type II [Gramella sp. GC03-9]|uniref:Haloacid dehalogenase type II n=1 Tax=Christiangramia oceanisediminis TaxID=2920386 RepID=A0A9X2I3A4_9FLAO|nr:haloacid dehalogenase type II [Gramella oceanisediminis]MCP9199060.1 haloacid dehalogenase type II [Gramella oceanisediminis]